MINLNRHITALMVAALMWGSPCSGFRALGSMYSDVGASAGGAVLQWYPIKSKVDGVGSPVKIYPVAVYTDRVHRYKYRVLVIKNPITKKKIYAHVIDECSDKSSSCKKNKRLARKRGRILLDIHRSGWKALGLSRYGLHPLKAGTVDTLSRKNSVVRSVLTNDGKKGYVAKGWK
jgi:hypothetical protein